MEKLLDNEYVCALVSEKRLCIAIYAYVRFLLGLMLPNQSSKAQRFTSRSLGLELHIYTASLLHVRGNGWVAVYVYMAKEKKE